MNLDDDNTRRIDTSDPDDTDHRLGALLARAEHPTTPATAQVREQIAHIALSVVRAHPPKRRRRFALVAAILAPVLVAGTATVAYAATTIDLSQFWFNSPEWAQWAETPDAIVHYTLPGGGTCEMRIGEVDYSPAPDLPAGITADPRSEAAARDFLRTPDLLGKVDIPGTIANMRVVDENWARSDDGTLVPFGYGTDNYDADVEYNMAVKQAIQVAISDHVESLGIPSIGYGYQSQEQCEGYTP